MRETPSKKRVLGGDHVEGRQAVRELLLAGRRKIREVVLSAELEPAPILDDIIDLADEQKIPIRELARGKFDSETHTQSSQGVMAKAAPLPDYTVEELLEDSRTPFLLLLDGVTDPGNVGALLRTAECAGITGVILPKHRAAHITPTVTKTAAGAIEHLDMAVVPGLPATITSLSERGVWTVGLDGAADDSLFDLAVADQPIALVLGAEGSGLSRLVAKRCDARVNIPMQGVLGSLNVASAGAIACFEIARRRGIAR